MYDTSPSSQTCGDFAGRLTRFVVDDPDCFTGGGHEDGDAAVEEELRNTSPTKKGATNASKGTKKKKKKKSKRMVRPIKSVTELSGAPRSMEMPRINPRVNGYPYRYLYAIDTDGVKGADSGAGEYVRWPWTALVRCDVGHTDTACSTVEWQAPPRCFLGDPTFVPRSGNKEGGAEEAAGGGAGEDRGEEEGWVLTLMFDAERASSFLLILDAADIPAGPVCTIDLLTHVPFSFHTAWFAGDFPGIISGDGSGDGMVAPGSVNGVSKL
jgi:carotenoid cleavage dioxygenase-like enzyme